MTDDPMSASVARMEELARLMQVEAARVQGIGDDISLVAAEIPTLALPKYKGMASKPEWADLSYDERQRMVFDVMIDTINELRDDATRDPGFREAAGVLATHVARLLEDETRSPGSLNKVANSARRRSDQR